MVTIASRLMAALTCGIASRTLAGSDGNSAEGIACPAAAKTTASETTLSTPVISGIRSRTVRFINEQ
jgi:hypothetical protein